MYSCNYDVFGADGKKDNRSCRGGACLSSIFYSYQPCSKLAFYVNVDNKEMKEVADWFEEKVIKKLLIDRVKGTFTVEEGWPKDVAVPHGCMPWKTVTFDGSKLSSADCYMLVCLYRYPQEFTAATQLCKKLVDEKQTDAISAYINSHSKCGNGNHSVFYNASYRYTVGKEIKSFKKWNLKKQWETLPKRYEYAKGTMLKSAYKDQSFTEQFKVVADDGWVEKDEDF